MSIQEIRVPDIGDFSDVDVIEVLVSPGDRVAEEDAIITLESDKASMDVPTSLAGTVREVKISVGDKVSEGSLVLLLETRVKRNLSLVSKRHHHLLNTPTLPSSSD